MKNETVSTLFGSSPFLSAGKSNRMVLLLKKLPTPGLGDYKDDGKIFWNHEIYCNHKEEQSVF